LLVGTPWGTRPREIVDRFGIGPVGFVTYLAQFSTSRCGTRMNSEVLLVTRVQPR
jgi:hypothetical protein